MSTIPDILAALKDRFSDLAPEVYDYIPASPTYPALCLYVESWPYATTDDATFIVLCLAGTVDTQDAQTTMMGWLSDTGDGSICAALDDDNTLGGVISSALPFQVRSWRPELDPSGKQVLVAEVELRVLR